MIAQHCTLDLDPTERVEPQPLLVLRPNNLMMRLHHR
jgi:hypothetical protein